MGEAVGEIILANQCGWVAVDSANPGMPALVPRGGLPASLPEATWLLVVLELAVPCWPTSRNLLSSATLPELTIGTDCMHNVSQQLPENVRQFSFSWSLCCTMFPPVSIF